MDYRLSVTSRLFGLIIALWFSTGCTATSKESISAGASSSLQWLAFRVRNDFSAELNADTGWAAPENAPAEIMYDQPFRFRVQVIASLSPAAGHLLSLQYRQQGQAWLPVGFSEFPYPDFATPVISVISTQAYLNGAETERLLGNRDMEWDEGAGLSAIAATPVWRTVNAALEWEWPLVIRRFSDGPIFAADGSVFELRVVDGSGEPLAGQGAAELRMSALPGHLGGTFIETPGRLGPYQSEEGHLYFFMEPSETNNRFMAVESTNFGRSWHEVDGARRPTADDLEGVASVRAGSVIHIIHQVSHEVFYHAFEMDGADLESGTWLVNSQSIARPEEPPTQFADIVARRDGSLVALYSGSRRLFLQIRSGQGVWGEPVEIDTDVTPDLSGPMLAVSHDDVVTMSYTGRDGSGFIRHLRPDGSLSTRQLLSSNLGSDDAENGAIVPLVVLEDSGSTVVLYREQDGMLYERRFSLDEQLSAPIQVTQQAVVTDAVDSEQVGADLVVHDAVLHLLFIEEQSRAIFYSRSDQPGIWTQPQVVIEGIQGSWVRGSVHRDASGNPVYGFVFDGGSKGGSGFNRYFALPL